eukprot:scaffold121114_cov14-Prasinocladus_malaysianus.AAC.1
MAVKTSQGAECCSDRWLDIAIALSCPHISRAMSGGRVVAEPDTEASPQLLPIADHHRQLRQKVLDGLPASGVIYLEVSLL